LSSLHSYVMVVIGHNDQCTEGDVRVEERCARFVTNSAESVVLSSNVMTSLVMTTALSHSMLEINKENSIESLGRLSYLLIHNFYLSMCMLK